MTERTTPNAPTARERVDDSCHEQALELLHGELRTSADGGTWRAPLTREQVKAMCREYDSLHAALLAARREVEERATLARENREMWNAIETALGHMREPFLLMDARYARERLTEAYNALQKSRARARAQP